MKEKVKSLLRTEMSFSWFPRVKLLHVNILMIVLLTLWVVMFVFHTSFESESLEYYLRLTIFLLPILLLVDVWHVKLKLWIKIVCSIPLVIVSVVCMLWLLLGVIFASNKDESLVTFNMKPRTSIIVSYIGDCGATCSYGDIVAYQKTSILGIFNSQKILLTIPKTPPEGFDYTKVDENTIMIHRKQFAGEYCSKNPLVNFCNERTYYVSLDK